MNRDNTTIDPTMRSRMISGWVFGGVANRENTFDLRLKICAGLLSVALSIVLSALTSELLAQTTYQVQHNAPNPSLALTTSSTEWTFRTIGNVTVESPIVRLRDLAEPTDPNLAAWKRLGPAPVGLVPLGGQEMTIDRRRLAELIIASEATPRNINWIGPETIRVRLVRTRRSTAISTQTISSGPSQHFPSARTGYSAAAPNQIQDQMLRASYRNPVDLPAASTQAVLLTQNETDRVTHWIQLAIKRFLPAIGDNYEVSIPPSQEAFPALRSIGGIQSVTPHGEVKEGTYRISVVGRDPDGLVNADIELELTEHPKVVVVSRTLGRGQRIQSSDLQWKPIPAKDLSPDWLVDTSGLVGLEVQSTLRRGTPIRSSDLDFPTLIHRGDLVELQVLGGGVVVSTNAKAVGSGAKGDLIEVETLSPRKRLVARVAGVGSAEIVTRPQQIR